MSLLALSWRRRQQKETTNTSSNTNDADDSAPSSPLPPAVTASNSGETTQSSSDQHDHGHHHHHHHHHQEESEETRAGARNISNSSNSRNGTSRVDSNNNNNSNSPPYIKLRLRTAPVTPDGLRPRPLTSLIREQLHVPEVATAATTTTTASTARKQRPFLMKKNKSVSTGVLPPAPSSSWSIPNNNHPLLHDHHAQHDPYRVLLTSPPVSNSSFYSGTGLEFEQKIAESPHLLPGQARTAVGALVALHHSSRQQLESAASSRVTGYDGDGSVEALHSSFQPLPKPTEWMMRRYHDDDDGDDVQDNGDNEEEEEGGDEIPPPYYPLDPETVNESLKLSPFRQEGRPGGKKQHPPMSPISTNSSILLGSPSSLARPYLLAKNNAKLARSSDDLLNKSSSSAAGLIPRDYEQQQERYDFGHVSNEAPAAVAPATAEDVVGYTDVVYAHPSDQTHVSAMSNSIPEHGALYGGGGNRSRSVNDDDDDDEEDDEEASDIVYQQGVTTPHMDGALLRQKVQNQRRLREELVLAVVERLQDDVQLVADVEAIGHAAVVMADWFAQTPLDCPGILTGFSLEQRKTILRHVTSVLDEMNVACPEDFFLSPSQVPGFAETHHDLCEALCFCLALVQMAIPQEEQNIDEYHREQGKWKLLPGLRTTLGIVPPDTPPEHHQRGRGGGDTSVFTLPSDSADTPMTSNVSITTTIESVSRNMSSSSFLRPLKHQPNGLQIRRTIEIVSTLVQRLSVACRALADMSSLQTEKSVRITKDIKNTYLQLIAMDHCDLRALVDAFELELSSLSSRPSMFITNLISTDADDEQQLHGAGAAAAPSGGCSIIPPPNLERKSTARNSSPVPEDFKSIEYSESGSSGTNLFSPCTDDMKSLTKPFGQSHHGNVVVRRHCVSSDFEDLRRSGGHIGGCTSNDHENENVVAVIVGGDEVLQCSNIDVDCINKFSFDDSPPDDEQDDFEDLRRMAGSNDYENDEDTTREGPEENGPHSF
jgi:hypothetical protein